MPRLSSSDEAAPASTASAPPTPSADPDPASRSDDRPDLGTRLAAWAFGVYVAVALPWVVFDLGEYHWFLGDDWDFLADRTAGSLSDLFSPHADHLSTLPVLVTRLEWQVFGFHYWRYQFVVVALHLSAAVLLRWLLRREGVNPWIASAAAALFVLYSPGRENMLWSFQLAWVMTINFGMLQLLNVTRTTSRSIERRDGLGLLAGFAALLSAGIAPVLIAVVGMVALVRRGWKVAAFHTAPLGAFFVVWFRATADQRPDIGGNPPPDVLFDWIRTGASAVVKGLGSGRYLGFALVLIAAAGIVVAWLPMARARRWRALATTAVVPVAMVAGAVLLMAATASGRWRFGVVGATVTRYVHLASFLSIPLLAIGFDALAKRWRAALPLLVVVLLAPVPGNIAGFDASEGAFSERYFDRARLKVEAIAWSPLAEEVPGDTRPIRDWLGGEGPSVGWLLDARRDGRIHRPDEVPPALQDEIEMRLGLKQTFADDGGGDPSRDMTCRTHSAPVTVTPAMGTRYRLETSVGVRLADARETAFFASVFSPLEGTELEVTLDDLDLVFSPLAGEPSFTLCTEP